MRKVLELRLNIEQLCFFKYLDRRMDRVTRAMTMSDSNTQNLTAQKRVGSTAITVNNNYSDGEEYALDGKQRVTWICQSQ